MCKLIGICLYLKLFYSCLVMSFSLSLHVYELRVWSQTSNIIINLQYVRMHVYISTCVWLCVQLYVRFYSLTSMQFSVKLHTKRRFLTSSNANWRLVSVDKQTTCENCVSRQWEQVWYCFFCFAMCSSSVGWTLALSSHTQSVVSSTVAILSNDATIRHWSRKYQFQNWN